MMNSRHLVSLLRHQPNVSYCIKRVYTTPAVYNTQTNKEKAESLTGKFISQVKKQYHKNTPEPTRYVQLEYLPSTATKEDIMKIAREAFPKGDQSVVETVFCRNDEFRFLNRCVILLSNAEEGRLLHEYANRRLVGGNIVKARFLGTPKSSPPSIMNPLRRPELVNIADYVSASGRSVIITGLPFQARENYLAGYLRSRNFFPVEGSSDSIIKLQNKKQASVAKYLVKFDSESEAWRCVRTFHNSTLRWKDDNDYTLQLSVAY